MKTVSENDMKSYCRWIEPRKLEKERKINNRMKAERKEKSRQFKLKILKTVNENDMKSYCRCIEPRKLEKERKRNNRMKAARKEKSRQPRLNV